MICPECGCDRKVLKECHNDDTWENRVAFRVITENCEKCKEAMFNERQNDLPDAKTKGAR